jgi:hypothetical protein
LTRGLALALALAAVLPAARASAEVVEMLDGDRFRGKIVAKRKTSLVLKTAYGSLTIPRSRVAKIVHDDGREEVLNVPLAAPSILPPPPPVRLVLIVTGDSFWYAWDPPKGTTIDPTLRLQVSIDEEPTVVYADAALDPGDLPKAVVNSFSFEPQAVTPVAGNDARPLPPESRPGRAVLKIDLPAPTAGRRRLRFAYQINDGSPETPAWRDCAEAALELELRDDAPTFVHLRQSRGRMEFAGFLRRKMKQVESFVVEARPERNLEDTGAPAP